MFDRERLRTQEHGLKLIFWMFTLFCMIAAVISPDRGQMLQGLIRICTQSGQVVKSYFDPSYGGYAGAYLNVALVCLVCTLLYYLPGAKPNGTSALAFFLTAGFSFWGITALSIWFCIPGVALYCLVKKTKLGSQANAILFVSGLAPLITDLLFRYPGENWQGATVSSVILALAVASFIGFFLPAGLPHSPKMHKGFDLYSAAVPIGLTAFFLRSVLYQVLGGHLPTSQNFLGGSNSWIAANSFAIVFFALCILVGRFLLGGSFTEYINLMKDSGHGADYSAKYGVGTATINLGIYGLFILLYYDLIGATWTAATLGCVFCMVCCYCNGSHPRNVWPIMVGYILTSLMAKYIAMAMGTEWSLAINVQSIVIGLCFANGLSPIAGKYGWPSGIVAGGLHYLLVTSVPQLHGGFCLYNGGLTAAFVCFFFVPILEHFVKTKEERAAVKNLANQ